MSNIIIDIVAKHALMQNQAVCCQDKSIRGKKFVLKEVFCSVQHNQDYVQVLNFGVITFFLNKKPK